MDARVFAKCAFAHSRCETLLDVPVPQVKGAVFFAEHVWMKFVNPLALYDQVQVEHNCLPRKLKCDVPPGAAYTSESSGQRLGITWPTGTCGEHAMEMVHEPRRVEFAVD